MADKTLGLRKKLNPSAKELEKKAGGFIRAAVGGKTRVQRRAKKRVKRNIRRIRRR